jgi:hypothetical protein
VHEGHGTRRFFAESVGRAVGDLPAGKYRRDARAHVACLLAGETQGTLVIQGTAAAGTNLLPFQLQSISPVAP